MTVPGPEALETYEVIQNIHHFEANIGVDYVTENEDDDRRVLRQRVLADEAQGLDFNFPWINLGEVTNAAGRLLYTEDGVGKFCTATVICDFTKGRSLIATAAHCVLNDEGEFNTDFLFIPKQDDGGDDTSNRMCDDDEFGCWTIDHIVVDNAFASGRWPYIIPADYAVLVVRDSTETHFSCDPPPISGGAVDPQRVCLNPAPEGNPDKEPILDKAVGGGMGYDCDNSQNVNGDLEVGERTMIWMLGYTEAEDPYFRYCEDDVREKVYPSFNGDNGGKYWYIKDCRLSKGASGGPVLPHTADNNVAGNNKMISIVSFERRSAQSKNIIGHGGPQLHDNSFCCLVKEAQQSTIGGGNIKFEWDGNKNCSPRKGGS